MHQTYEINTGKISTQFLESILATTRARFGTRDVKITIEDVETTKSISQKELFQRMEEHRKSLRYIKVDPTLDLSALANEMNDTPL